MHYTITHTTRFVYQSPIAESVMEVRMQPRSEGFQWCQHFELHTTPRASVLAYRDGSDNAVHHFNIPGRHRELVVTARSTVDMQQAPAVPDALSVEAWQTIDQLEQTGEFWDYRHQSRFAVFTPRIHALASTLDVDRTSDPLTVLNRVTAGIYERFEYLPKTTNVDSAIDEAFDAGGGVCQDFAHIMIALVRTTGIPCRYVSGYLPRDAGRHDRSEPAATHAWVEAWLPELGWTGFDPTNGGLARDRHVRVAIGRDYSDVPPTRGVFKGEASSELQVAVEVRQTDSTPAPTVLGEPVWAVREIAAPPTRPDRQQQEQMQQ